ncbi:hypothetical protein L207DRAFT_513592 [Hyaloscypha variabilis F]|uniref:Uncharacterized protein n=1 Tax=Hyaloscypha variabilis (strain UAMH 11265 / GT02V1 / F) TaxID=1149755 RepID=A0A2J6RKT6_HYAVF|nr:hypothetical protein L207DRAFT_513592 [Hyaloscypha variabilis F]
MRRNAQPEKQKEGMNIVKAYETANKTQPPHIRRNGERHKRRKTSHSHSASIRARTRTSFSNNSNTQDKVGETKHPACRQPRD